MLILNVDDDSDDREIFSDAVRVLDPNISLAQVESGANALLFLNSGGVVPDYLFIDNNMPKISGIECVKKIISIPRFLTIHIVMYSTAFTPGDRTYLAEMGITCLAKQSRLSDLVSSLKNLLLNDLPVKVE